MNTSLKLRMIRVINQIRSLRYLNVSTDMVKLAATFQMINSFARLTNY